MTPDEAKVMLVMAELALRAVKRDGASGPGDRYRRVLAAAALDAPEKAATCREVLRFTRVAREVNELVRALNASGNHSTDGDGAQWLTAAQAATLLGLKPDSVWWALRHGRLAGKRTECGWRIDLSGSPGESHYLITPEFRGSLPASGVREVAWAWLPETLQLHVRRLKLLHPH